MFMSVSDHLEALGFTTLSRGNYQLYLLDLPP